LSSRPAPEANTSRGARSFTIDENVRRGFAEPWSTETRGDGERDHPGRPSSRAKQTTPETPRSDLVMDGHRAWTVTILVCADTMRLPGEAGLAEIDPTVLATWRKVASTRAAVVPTASRCRYRTQAATQAPSTGHTRTGTKASVSALFMSDVVFAKGATGRSARPGPSTPVPFLPRRRGLWRPGHGTFLAAR